MTSSDYQRQWYLNNKERLAKKHREYYQQYYHSSPRVKEGYWRRQLKANYGITPEDYQALLERQGFKCAICETNKPGGRGKWHVDHDHDTKVVRGLLCQKCNMGLGMFKDSKDLLAQASNYLQPQYVAGNTEWL